ncbi:hypothetical protein [Sulfitobacter pacificus]|uniref:hypothetical protein n=1 Tax=Sulfitobacter pacificus TaxID=1499314 RepID=UPI003108D00E
MDRRAFIAAAPMAAISTRAIASSDPHPALFAAYVDADDLWTEQTERADGETPEAKATWAERERLCLLITQTKATTVEGLAAQFAWFKHDLGYIIEGMAGDPYSGVMGMIEEGFKEITHD